MKAINFGTNESFIKKYQELKSSRKMAEFFNCSKTAVLNHARKIGYDTSDNKEIKIPQKDLEKIISLYESGLSTTELSKIYNCSTTAIVNFLNKNNYKLQNSLYKLATISDDDFIKNYESLKSAEKVGKIYNCSATAILNHAKKIGYNVEKNIKITKEDKKKICEEYNNKTSTELAKEYNVSRGMITKIWHDNGMIGKNVIIKTIKKDIVGQRFGKWTVLYKTNKRNTGGIIYWHCKCDCGIEKDVLGSSLRNGLSLSCGSHNNISKGNEKIKEILIKNNIPFETEKKFTTCKDIKELPFDFYINNQYLIEYDGEQHFLENSVFDYEYTHKHDIIKNKWCKDNNIHLIRIPYTHYTNLNINDLLLETTDFLVN